MRPTRLCFRLYLLVLSLSLAFGSMWVLVRVGAAFQEQQSATEKRHADELSRARQTLEQALKLHAAHLLATATQLGTDSTLTEGLTLVGQGVAEPALLQKTLENRLAALSQHRGLSAAWLLDATGTVLAQHGQGPNARGESLRGLPAVDASLRGYRLDDLMVWDRGKETQVKVVAAVPLATLSRDRFAGVLLAFADLPVESSTEFLTAWQLAKSWLSPQNALPQAPPDLCFARPGSVPHVVLCAWKKAPGPTVNEPLPAGLQRLARWVHTHRFRGFLIGFLLALGMFGLGLALSHTDEHRLPVSSGVPAPDAAAAFPPSSHVRVSSSPSEASWNLLSTPKTLDHLPTLFSEFVIAKTAAGESLSGLSYDLFCAELSKTATQVTEQTGCQTVFFRVLPDEKPVTMRATPTF